MKKTFAAILCCLLISRIAEPGKRDISLRIYVDRSSVEIFAEGGKKVLTSLTYASPDQTGVEFFTLRGAADLNLSAWPLKGINI